MENRKWAWREYTDRMRQKRPTSLERETWHTCHVRQKRPTPMQMRPTRSTQIERET